MAEPTDKPYRLSVEPILGKVTARRGDYVLAASDTAVMMHETRLPPTVYFPKHDSALLVPTRCGRRTFCPFKGTATYWDIIVGGEMTSNAAWSYENVLPESEAIEGHIAFMPGVVDVYETTDGLPAPTEDGDVKGALVNWLMREAWMCLDPMALTRHLGNRMVLDGIAVSRINVTIWSLHPQIAGASYVWHRDSDDVTVESASHDRLKSAEFINSPIRYVSEGLGGVRQLLTADEAEFSFPIMADLKAEGATDYVAMPLSFSNGQINVLTMASDHPTGFKTANLGLMFECSAVISRYYEVLTQRANASVLLETYLGARTGQRVLGGEIRRGDGDDIDAAILYCDLRHSSRLAEEMPRDDYLALLNGFFESIVGLVRDYGGEVLKFIGDAVLAIFPEDGNAERACANAIRAASAIVDAVADIKLSGGKDPLACSIGASYGRVTYGNVGSADRLDFTVIGAAANIAARLADLGKVLGEPALATAAVARAAPHDMALLGAHGLHNVSEPVEVFAPVRNISKRAHTGR